MEYVYRTIINNIIKYLNWIAFSIKTDKQVFIFSLPVAPIEPTVVCGGIERPTNIRLGYVVFEAEGLNSIATSIFKI